MCRCRILFFCKIVCFCARTQTLTLIFITMALQCILRSGMVLFCFALFRIVLAIRDLLWFHMNFRIVFFFFFYFCEERDRDFLLGLH